MYKITKIHKFISCIALLILVWENIFLNNADALAPWIASQSPAIKREIWNALERTQIIYAESDEAKNLLDANNADALLLSHGKYLVRKEVADDKIRLARAIIHEDIEALMQILQEEDRYVYNGIKELILNNRQIKQCYYDLCYQGKKPDHLTAELMLNDIVAKALEIMFVVQNGLVVAEDYKSPEEKAKETLFYLAIKPIMTSNRHNYFRSGLCISAEDSRNRSNRIKEAFDKGFIFYQAADAKEPSVDLNRENDDVVLARLFRILPGYATASQKTLDKLIERFKTERQKGSFASLDDLSRRVKGIGQSVSLLERYTTLGMEVKSSRRTQPRVGISNDITIEADVIELAGEIKQIIDTDKIKARYSEYKEKVLSILRNSAIASNIVWGEGMSADSIKEALLSKDADGIEHEIKDVIEEIVSAILDNFIRKVDIENRKLDSSDIIVNKIRLILDYSKEHGISSSDRNIILHILLGVIISTRDIATDRYDLGQNFQRVIDAATWRMLREGILDMRFFIEHKQRQARGESFVAKTGQKVSVRGIPDEKSFEQLISIMFPEILPADYPRLTELLLSLNRELMAYDINRRMRNSHAVLFHMANKGLFKTYQMRRTFSGLLEARIHSRGVLQLFEDIRNVVKKQCPEGTRLTVVSFFSASDITTPLLTTNASRILLYDAMPFEPKEEERQYERWKIPYLSFKASEGFIQNEIFEVIGNARVPIFWELHALGATDIKVKKENERTYSISFDWPYDGEREAVRREIVYSQVRFHSKDELAKILEEVNPDILLKKADLGFGLPDEPTLPPIIISFDDIALKEFEPIPIGAKYGAHPEELTLFRSQYVDLTKAKVHKRELMKDREPPAIALRFDDITGKWTKYSLTKSQHKIINMAWENLWDDAREVYPNTAIFRDIKKRLYRHGMAKLPIHIQTLPEDILYNRIYAFAKRQRVDFPPRGEFKLISHPGTYRDSNNEPRSYNLLIPEEAYKIIDFLIRRDLKAYKEWVDHEVSHIIDRTKRIADAKESQITSVYPVDYFLSFYMSVLSNNGEIPNGWKRYWLAGRNSVFIDATMKNGVKSGGRCVGTCSVAGSSGIFGKHPDCVVMNVQPSTKSGHMYLEGTCLGAHFKAGQQYTVEVHSGKPARIYDANGVVIPFFGDKDSENAIYVGGSIENGKLAGGEFVRSYFKDGCTAAVLKKYPNCIITRVKVIGHTLKRFGMVIGQSFEDGDELTMKVEKGKLVKIFDRHGNPVPFAGDKDSRNAVFINATIKSGKLIRGKFVAAYPARLTRSVLKKYPNCVIANMEPFKGKSPMLKLADIPLVKIRDGSYLVEVKDGKPVKIYGVNGAVVPFWGDREAENAIFINGIIRNGRVTGGTFVRAVPGRHSFSDYIREYPDCVVTNRSISSKGSISGEPLGMKYGDTEGNTVQYKSGNIERVWNDKGILIYERAVDDKNYYIYTNAVIENGKVAKGNLIVKAMHFSADILNENPDCVVANANFSGKGRFILFGQEWVCSKKYYGEKRVTAVFSNGRLANIYDKEGELIYSAPGKSPSDSMFEELLQAGDIERLAANFGLEGAYRMLLRVHDFAPDSLRELLNEYKNKALRRNTKAEASGDVKKRFSFVRMRKLAMSELFKRLKADILADEITRSVYKDITADHRFLDKILQESYNRDNSGFLRAAYRKVYNYYKEIEKLEIGGISSDKITLKFYQKMGIKFLMDTRKAILADEPGLGKTIQAIAAALNINKGRGARKVLIICPKSAKKHWQKEIENNTTGRQKVVIVNNATALKSRKMLRRINEGRFIVVNYEAIRGEGNGLRGALKGMGFDCIIVDEAHRMRNESLQTDAIRGFDAEYKFLLTGTPLVGRRISKIFNLLNWINPDVFPNKAVFSLTYGRSAGQMRQLNDDVRGFLLRRLKSDMLDLPPPSYITIPVTLGREQRIVYQAIEKNFKEWMSRHRDLTETARPIVIAKLTKLAQAAIDTSLVEKKKGSSSAKFEGLDKLVEGVISRGEKAVIFTNYRNVVFALKDRYRKYGTNYILGGMTSAAIDREIDNFQNRSDTRIFIATMKTGGEAISLTSANNVIFIDKPWTPQEMEQAVCRLHRIGQNLPVNVYSITAEDTIDEYIEEVLAHGRLVFRLALEDDPSAGNFTEEMIEEILKSLNYSKELIEKIKTARRVSAGSISGKSRYLKTLAERNGMRIELGKDGFCMKLKTDKGKTIKIERMKDLLDSSAELSEDSKKLIREFFIKRLRDEREQDIPIKKSVLWLLMTAVEPRIAGLDYDGEVEVKSEIGRIILGLITEDEDVSIETLMKKIDDRRILRNSLHFLDRNNIFKALSLMGVLNKQFYYKGKLLYYDPPLRMYAFDGRISYVDSGMVERIAPERIIADRKVNSLYPFESEAARYRTLTRSEEIRIAREARRGNSAAQDALIKANMKVIVAVAKRTFSRFRVRLGNLERSLGGLDINDLYSAGQQELFSRLQDYYNEYEKVTLAEFSKATIAKAVSASVSEYLKVHRSEISDVMTEGEGAEEGMSLFDLETAKKAKHKKPAEDKESMLRESGLVKDSIAILETNGFREDEIDAFLDFLRNDDRRDIGERYKLSSKHVDDIIETALKLLKGSSIFAGYAEWFKEDEPEDDSGSPAEALRIIYKEFGFNEFYKDDLRPLRKHYRPSTVDMEVRMLRRLGILLMRREGNKTCWRLNDALRSSSDEETERNIAAVYNIKFKIGRKEAPLDKYSIPDDKIPAVREQVRTELMHRNLEETLKVKVYDKPVIRIWSGYAKSNDQKSIIQEIRKKAPAKGYDIDFGNITDEEESVRSLVDFAVSNDGRLNNAVTILPSNHAYVKVHMEELKTSHVIFMDFEKDVSADDFVQIGGIVSVAMAYLNNNNLALMNLYKLLTDNTSHPDIAVDDLRKNPIVLKFILRPVRVENLENLRYLNNRLRELLISA